MAALAIRSILVPVDGSRSSDAALGLACRLLAPGGTIVAVHVINRAAIIAECITPYGGDATAAIAAIEGDERDIFARAAKLLRAANVPFTTIAIDGQPVSSITSQATTSSVDAIAMGTHGRTGVARLALGNTAAGVIGKTHIPVFVVHELDFERATHAFKTIVVAFDGSPAANDAARAAVDLALPDSGRVVFAFVAPSAAGHAPPDIFADVEAYAAAGGVAYESVVLSGPPVEAIINSVATAQADLIAIGAHGRVEKLFGIGSVAQAIARTSPVPVLVVPAPVSTEPGRATQEPTLAPRS